MVDNNLPRFALVLLFAGVLVLAGCGGGYGEVYIVDTPYYEPIGDVEVDNQTDLGGTFEDMYGFYLAPAGSAGWTGNLLSDLVYPGEIAFVGSFYADFYDADADLDLGTVSFFDVLVEDGYTTTFEVW